MSKKRKRRYFKVNLIIGSLFGLFAVGCFHGSYLLYDYDPKGFLSYISGFVGFVLALISAEFIHKYFRKS